MERKNVFITGGSRGIGKAIAKKFAQNGYDVIVNYVSENTNLEELEKAELCFDINEYNGITDYEIEYEQTCDHDGITVFNQILSQVNLKYEKNCASKIKRTLKSK